MVSETSRLLCKTSGGDEKGCVLLMAALSSFLTPYTGSSINIALPSIGEEFYLDAVFLSWIPMAFLLSASVFLVPFGRLSDIYGRRRIFGYGILIFTIASLSAGLSVSPWMLLISRIAQGLGSAMIFGTSVAMLSSVYPHGERGWAMGITIAAVYLGLSTGPFLGGILTQYAGWRSIFFVSVTLGLTASALTYFRLKRDWVDAPGEKFDLVGSVLFGSSVFAFVYGSSLLPGQNGIVLIAFGMTGLLSFGIVELHQKSPVVEVRLFLDNRHFALSNLAALINYAATFAVGFLLSLYLQYIKGFDSAFSGAVLVSQPIVMTLLSPIAGRLSDRIEPGSVATAGMLVTALGIIPFVFLSAGTSLFYIVSSLAVLGCGLAMFSSPNTNAIMSSVEKRFYGIASATLGTMRLFGQMFSMGLAMTIFAIYLGRVEIDEVRSEQLMSAIHIAFSLFSILCLIGIMASNSRGRIKKPA
jgi:MFS family permease